MDGPLTPGRPGLTLAERRTLTETNEHMVSQTRPAPPPNTMSVPAARDTSPVSVGARHCWVTGLPGRPQRCAGLLAEWRRDGQAGCWQGRVVYAVDDDTGRAVLVEAWLPAEHLHPAGH